MATSITETNIGWPLNVTNSGVETSYASHEEHPREARLAHQGREVTMRRP